MHGCGYLGTQNRCISPIPVHKSETPCISPEALSPPKNRTYTQTYARGGGRYYFYGDKRKVKKKRGDSQRNCALLLSCINHTSVRTKCKSKRKKIITQIEQTLQPTDVSLICYYVFCLTASLLGSHSASVSGARDKGEESKGKSVRTHQNCWLKSVVQFLITLHVKDKINQKLYVSLCTVINNTHQKGVAPHHLASTGNNEIK